MDTTALWNLYRKAIWDGYMMCKEYIYTGDLAKCVKQDGFISGIYECLKELEQDENKTLERSYDIWLEVSRGIEESSHWIPVEKRLPDPDTEVLVTIKSGDQYDVQVVRYRDAWPYSVDEITAWMPLPESYKPDNGRAGDT